MNNNKLIAEFMGWDIKSPTAIPSNLHLSNLELDNGGVWAYKFHTSWDWLMPVVQKCFDTQQPEEGQHYFINESLLTMDIEVVYDRVVEFIKTYNSYTS